MTICFINKNQAGIMDRLTGIFPYLEKITAFVTRSGLNGLELLVFQHPTAGIQIPAGTVEEGETIEQAAFREVAEETGLYDISLRRYLGWRDEVPARFTHVIYRETKVYSRPDLKSFDWASFRRGIGVRMQRQANGFAQVTYDESNRYPDPEFITYSITGWVPLECLAAVNRRHFFHFTFHGTAPERWEQFSDNHLFQPFWAPFDHLPAIVEPQHTWLEFFPGEVGDE